LTDFTQLQGSIYLPGKLLTVSFLIVPVSLNLPSTLFIITYLPQTRGPYHKHNRKTQEHKHCWT